MPGAGSITPRPRPSMPFDRPSRPKSTGEAVPLRGRMLRCLIEPEPRLGELALGEGEDLGGPDLEDVGDACIVMEGAVAHVEAPVALVFVEPPFGQVTEELTIGHACRAAFHDDVKARLPVVG